MKHTDSIYILPVDGALFCMMSAEISGSHVSHEQSERAIHDLLHLKGVNNMNHNGQKSVNPYCVSAVVCYFYIYYFT